MLPFFALAQQCAPTVAPQTMAAIVRVESHFNPYAIGVVGGHLARQPKTLDEAVATAQSLAAHGWNFSLGIAQVNRHNLPKFNANYAQAFDPCKSLHMGSKILEDCYERASVKMPGNPQGALKAAFSCYYAGNFTGGFASDGKHPSYVQKVLASADAPAKPIQVVPAIKGSSPAPATSAQAAAAMVRELSPPPDHSPVLVDAHANAKAKALASVPREAPDTGPVMLHRATPDDETVSSADDDATIF